MPEDSTVKNMTDEEKMLLVTKFMESEKGLGFLMEVLAHPRSRVQFKIEIDVTRIPVKE